VDECQSKSATALRRAILAVGFEVTAEKKQEKDGVKRRCFHCGKKERRKHNTVYRCCICYKPICLSQCSPEAVPELHIKLMQAIEQDCQNFA